MNGNAQANGAAVYFVGGPFEITNNQFINNTATEGAGGLYAPGMRGTITGNTFENNRALNGQAGAALIATSGSTFLISNNIFEGNSASGNGGALYLYGSSSPQFSIDGNRFIGNHTDSNGGSISTSPNHNTHLYLRDNLFAGNSAAHNGGAVDIASGVVMATNNVFASNSSMWEAVYLSSAHFDAIHTTFYDNGNYALTGNGSATLTNTIVASHTVGAFAGANINANYTLFHNIGIPCSEAAVCSNVFIGNPDFVNPGISDYLSPIRTSFRAT